MDGMVPIVPRNMMTTVESRRSQLSQASKPGPKLNDWDVAEKGLPGSIVHIKVYSNINTANEVYLGQIGLKDNEFNFAIK